MEHNKQNTRIDTKTLHSLYMTFNNLFSEKKFDECRLFIKGFCNEDTDINILRTLLVILKGLKHRPDFKDLSKDIHDILYKKTGRTIL